MYSYQYHYYTQYVPHIPSPTCLQLLLNSSAPTNSSSSSSSIPPPNPLNLQLMGIPIGWAIARSPIRQRPRPTRRRRISPSPAPAPASVDGLGDRQRSISPLDEHPSWHAFLSTVVPDPVAPSASSSFASAAAASFPNSNPPSSRAASSARSAASSHTHITVPSRLPSPPRDDHVLPRACDTEEDGSASDTEPDEPSEVDANPNSNHDTSPWQPPPVYSSTRRALSDAIESRRQVSATVLQSRRRIRPSYFSHEPPMRHSERYSRRVLERSRDASAYVRRLYHASPPPPHQRTQPARRHGFAEPPIAPTASDETSPSEPADTPPDTPPLDQELRDARSLLDRLSRRRDISSDDFWASVGLSRSFADPVERFQERERF